MDTIRWSAPFFFIGAGDSVYVIALQNGRVHHVAFALAGDLKEGELEALLARPYAPDAEVHLMGDRRQRYGRRWLGCSLTERARVVDHDLERREDGQRLIIRARDEETGLVVEYRYDTFTRSRCIRRSLRIVNHGRESQTLEHVAPIAIHHLPLGKGSLDDLWYWDVGGGWCWEGRVRQVPVPELGIHDTFSMGAHIVETSGSWTTKHRMPVFGLEDRHSSRSWAVQVDPVGSWRLELGAFDGGVYLQAGGGNFAGGHWQRTLRPGDAYESPAVTVAVAPGGRDAAVNLLQDHRARHLIRRSDGDSGLPVVYNEYLASMANPTAQAVSERAAALDGMGIDVFVIDGGWNQPSDAPPGAWWNLNGHWETDPTRFPGGLIASADDIKGRGMSPGIWVELEAVGSEAPLRHERPDWFVTRGGQPVEEGARRILDFANPDVARYARRVMENLFADGFRYWKIDYNVEIPLGVDHPDGLGAGLEDQVCAFRAWLQALRTDHPELIIENCASGGNRLDYGLLSLTDLCSITDHAVWEEAWHTLPGLVSGVAYAVHPSQLGIWAALDGTLDLRETAYRLVSTLVGRVHLSGAVETLRMDQRTLVIEALAFYKTWQHVVATARVYHLLEPVSLHRPADWVAIQLASDSDEHLVAVWRRDSPDEQATIQLSEVDPHISYEVSQFPAGPTVLLSGADLTEGYAVTLTNRFQGVAFGLRPAMSSTMK